MVDQKETPVTEVDLANLDESYAASEVTDNDYDSIPDGRYQALVERVELTRTGKGDPMLKWMLRVTGPTHQGRVLFRYNVLTQENMTHIKKDLYACGLELGKISELPAHLERLLDLRLEVTKKTKGDFEAVYINKRIRTDGGGSDDKPGGTGGTAAGKPSGKARQALAKF
jgi:hypothetical protein